jgi:hypothetical protein
VPWFEIRQPCVVLDPRAIVATGSPGNGSLVMHRGRKVEKRSETNQKGMGKMAASTKHSYVAGALRSLTEPEIALLAELLSGREAIAPLMKGLPQAKVQAMNDGGMGSIRFIGKDSDHREFGRIVREATFQDTDGVPVLASLIVDQFGALYELTGIIRHGEA